jgi:hypothetical protein
MPGSPIPEQLAMAFVAHKQDEGHGERHQQEENSKEKQKIHDS